MRKVKGTIHWVDKNNYENISVNIYDKLFLSEAPGEDDEVGIATQINNESIKTFDRACAEISLRDATFDKYYQFQRKGYFKLDSKNPKVIFNRTVTLRDNIKY